MKKLIPNRVLIGHRSKNGHYISRKALEEAIPMAEGRQLFEDHEQEIGKMRKFKDLLGRAINCKYDPNRGMVGDLEVDDDDPVVKKLEKFIEDGIPVSGISFDGDATFGMYEGKKYMVKIDKIRSFDLVAQPSGEHILAAETPADPTIEEKIVQFVTPEQYQALEQRIKVLEAIKVPVPMTAPPTAPLPPAIPVFGATVDVSQLIKNCRS